MKSILTAILITVILSGCAEAAHREAMESWLNQPTSLLKQQWGEPTVDIPLKGGGIMSRYNRGWYKTTPTISSTAMMPMSQSSSFYGNSTYSGNFSGTVSTTSYYPSTITIPGGTVYEWCCTDFYSSVNNIIYDVRWQGDCY